MSFLFLQMEGITELAALTGEFLVVALICVEESLSLRMLICAFFKAPSKFLTASGRIEVGESRIFIHAKSFFAKPHKWNGLPNFSKILLERSYP